MRLWKNSQPSHSTTEKDSFVWSDEAQTVGDTLKKALVEIPILTVPDFSTVFTIETNASNKGLGAVLMQKGRPVAFLSQTLSAEWEEEVRADGKLRRIMQDLLQHSDAHPGYVFRDRKLWYKGKLVLPKNSPKIPLLGSYSMNTMDQPWVVTLGSSELVRELLV